jgi:hypothetical protein
MRQLQNAANGTGVRGLVDLLYDQATVVGFGLGVHGHFIALYVTEVGGASNVEQMLAGGKIPPSWPTVCAAATLPATLSPIYVVVYVTVPPATFTAQNPVPQVIPPGHLVIVEQIDPFEEAADRTRHRPNLCGGISLGNSAQMGAGTLGGFFKNVAGDPLILSCAHVIEDAATTDVIQQGTKDGGAMPYDLAGSTLWAAPLTPPTGFMFGSPYLKADAALANVDASCTAIRTIRTLSGDVTAIAPLAGMSLGDDVVFVGKESDCAMGRVFRFIARAKVKIRGIVYNFGDIFEIESRYPIYIGSLVRPGDSGSWVIYEKPAHPSGVQYDMYGLLFARNGKTGLCCVAEDVKSELERVAGPGQTFALY